LAVIRFWTCSKFKGTAALKKKVNLARIPLEEKASCRRLENWRESIALFCNAARCIHVGDRESDIYALFCMAHEFRTHFLVRTCVDGWRAMASDTIAAEMNGAEISEIPARAHDPLPGNTVRWRGLSRLADIWVGMTIELNLRVVERVMGGIRPSLVERRFAVFWPPCGVTSMSRKAATTSAVS
jgi:hypothetical protein